MSEARVRPARALDLPLVESVLHPTDFSPASERAFAHALAVALLRRTHFTLLNVSRDPTEQDWSEFPAVRETLERWGLLEPGSPRSAVYREFGVRVQKITARGRNPVQAIAERIAAEPVELIVLATEARGGLSRWWRRSVAGVMTLFVPRGARGFVDLDDGHLALKRILLPVAAVPSAQDAVKFAIRTARQIGEGDVEIALLHVGNEMPQLKLVEDPAFSFSERLRRGAVVDEIVAAADCLHADLVIMTTGGRQGLGDALRGTCTERVLRRVSCPLLAIPAERRYPGLSGRR
jgi:nucleotide-binding universal stress UspA family protein